MKEVKSENFQGGKGVGEKLLGNFIPTCLDIVVEFWVGTYVAKL